MLVARDAYDRQVVECLITMGADPVEAERIARGRFPLELSGAIAECYGRGLLLSRDDLRRFLLWKFAPRTTFAGGEPIEPEGMCWPGYLIDEALAWAVATGAGRPSSEVPTLVVQPIVSVDDLLWGLRQPDRTTRLGAGLLLARSFREGLERAGETPDDIENIIGPQFLAVLGRAVEGDAAAVDELASIITADAERAHRPHRPIENAASVLN